MAAKKALGKGLDVLIPNRRPAGREESRPQEAAEKKNTVSSSVPETAELSKAGTEVPEEGVEKARLVKITEIERNKKQPRRTFPKESLQELAESIRQFGVLQPLLVKAVGSRFMIIAGERRWRAAKLAGLKEVPVLVRDYSDQEILEISLIENIQREDLDVIEEAQAYQRLLEEFGYRQEDLAEKLSKSRTVITNRIRLLRLPEGVRELLREGKLSEGHARALLSLEKPEEQEEAARQVAENGLSVRETEKLVKKLQEPEKEKTVLQESPGDAAAYEKLAEELQNAIGSKVQIRRQGKGKGRITIDYYSLDELERIAEILKKHG